MCHHTTLAGFWLQVLAMQSQTIMHKRSLYSTHSHSSVAYSTDVGMHSLLASQSVTILCYPLFEYIVGQ